LRKYEKKYGERIRVVSNPVNVGLGQTRDHGMQYARGRYVVFLDSDDCIKPDYLQRYYEKMEAEQLDVTLGGYIYVTGEKKKRCNLHMKENMHWLWPTACMRMYRRSFLEENGLNFHGIRLYEDEPFTYRVMANKPKTGILDYCGYYYIVNKKSLTNSGEKGSRADAFYKYMDVIRPLAQEMSQYELSKEEYNIYEFGIVSGLIANTLYNGQASGQDKMMDIHKVCFDFLEEHFSGYMSNPYFKLWRLPQVEWKKRICTWLVIFLRRWKLDRLFFRLVGMI
jgi:glycosyltransferase involved in cell wall biosynthesis